LAQRPSYEPRVPLDGSSRKAWTSGCHRARSPEETLGLLEPWLRRAQITRVADVTGLDYPGIPTVMVTRPNGRSLSVTQGKGITLEAAKVSGIMEAVEHDHAETPEIPLVLARLEAVLGRTCRLDRLPRIARSREKLTADTRLLWAEARVLGTTDTRLVPFEMVHLDFTLPLPEGHGFFPLCSNGLASGNTLDEAVAHGLFELIERDARTLHFCKAKAERDRRRVDPESVTDAEALRLLERFERSGLATAVWDITTDLGVAAFLVGVLEKGDNWARRVPLAYGSGAHTDRNVALLRALTEAAQTRLTNVAGIRDDTLPEQLEHARSAARQSEQRAELAFEGDYGRRFDEVPHVTFDSFDEDLAYVRERLGARGVDQILTVDLSRAGWPVNVVRVIAPGLEGHVDLPDYVPGPRAAAVSAGAP